MGPKHWLFLLVILFAVGCGGGDEGPLVPSPEQSGSVARALDSVVLTPAEATIGVGTVQQFQVVGTFSDGTKQDLSGEVSWTSSSPSVATVSVAGLASAVSPGKTTVSVRLGTKTTQAKLTVSEASLVSIVVSPRSLNLSAGSEHRFTATANLSDGSAQDVTVSAQWSTNEPGVATTSRDGVVSAQSPGESLVRASVNGVVGEANLRVLPGFFTFLERVSVSTAGTEANEASNLMELSDDGSQVAFISFATNLDDGDANTLNDLYLRDRTAGVTELISKNHLGAQGVEGISISGDGKRLAFVAQGNLVTGDQSGASIFVYDRTDLSRRRFPSIIFGGQTVSREGQLSFDGRISSFTSSTNSLDPPDNNGSTGFDIFVYDETTDAVDRVSQNDQGVSGNGGSSNADLSSDGRFVAFSSGSTNLVAGDNNGVSDLFVFDRALRVVERVSVSSSGEEGNAGSRFPSLSDDGRFVAFESEASNLVPNDLNGRADIFVFDRNTKQTERVSVSSSGVEANSSSGISYFDAISSDGRFVVFSSQATNLVPADTNDRSDTFVFDRAQKLIRRTSLRHQGGQGDGSSNYTQLSGNGRWIAFTSTSSNLVENDTNSRNDIFVVPNPFAP